MTRPDSNSAAKVGRAGLLAALAIFLVGGVVAAVTLLADDTKKGSKLETKVVTLPGSKIPASIGDRSKYVQGLSDVQKQELEEKKKKFDMQSPERKKQLRKLAKQLAEHKDSAKLSSTLTMYHDFLISLDESEMIRLRTAADDPDKKIEVIRSIESARTEWMKHFPRSSDAAAIYQWTLELARKHREHLDPLVAQWKEALAEAPSPGQHRPDGMPQGPGHIEQMLVKAVQSDKPEKAELATVMVYRHAMWLARNRRDEWARLAAKDEEIEQLLSRLSPLLSGFYRNYDPEKKPELLRGWQQFATFTMGRGLPSDNEVYAELPRLSEADQKQVAPLPLDQKKWWLVKKAFDERMDFKPPPSQNPPPGTQRPGWNNGFGGPRFESWSPSKKKDEPGGKGPPRDGQPRNGGPPGPPPGDDRPPRPGPRKSAAESPTPKADEPKSEQPKSDGDESREADKSARQFARKNRAERAN